METTVSLLMTEASEAVFQLCQARLPAHGIALTICPRNGAATCEALASQMPNAALLDVFMPAMDALEVKQQFQSRYPEAKTVFYATGAFQDEKLEREIIDNGFAFYYLKPFDVDAFARRLLADCQAVQESRPGAEDCPDAREQVADMLREIGVPAHVKGYRFVRDAILMTADDPALINAVTKVLYPEIAARHSTTASRVERAIRHGIEIAWERGDIEVLNHYFGGTINSQRGKPTNSEFIAMLSDRLALGRQHYIQ